MRRVRSRKLAIVPEQLYAELSIEVADMAEAVVRTALHIKINAVMAAAAEVDRAAEALQAARGYPTETVEQARPMATSAATAYDLQAVETAEAANCPSSPQPDGHTGNASRGEIGLIDELNAKLEAAFAEPKDASCREENAIATRIAELHDRLGGFIKPFANADA